VKYHYFHRFFTYSVKRKASLAAHVSGFKSLASGFGRSAPKTVSGGEFDWGGTSVKR
jgi:hypothetical protein